VRTRALARLDDAVEDRAFGGVARPGVHGASLTFSAPMEKQPTAAELEQAARRARADAEARFACEESGREPDDQPGDAGPYAYAAEAVQAEYARVYEETLAELRRNRPG
jgi:hypothetical protein